MFHLGYLLVVVVFSCDVTFTEYGYEDDSSKTEVQAALELDVYNLNGADFYEPVKILSVHFF